MDKIKELCPECCGEKEWYGVAPHDHVIYGEGEDFICTTKIRKKKDWPNNYIPDKEDERCGIYLCNTCKGKGYV